MNKKPSLSIGIDYDTHSIRAASVKRSQLGDDFIPEISALEELHGDFTSDKALIDGLRRIKESLGQAQHYITCVCGKQIYASHMRFRRLPDQELRGALRLELRKTLPFEVSGSILEYQHLDSHDKKAEKVDLLVTVVAGELMQKHIHILDKAGIKPDIVDILPTAIANAFWNSRAQEATRGTAHVMLHIGAAGSTLVFDGEGATFFTRHVPFAAAEIFAPSAVASERDVRFKIDALVDEVVRSLSFYEKTYRISSFPALYLMGEYLDKQELYTAISRGVGLPIQAATDLKKLGYTENAPFGKYDVAVALALREE